MNWSSDFPTEEGHYWFYGDPWAGSEGGEPSPSSLFAVEIHRDSRGLYGMIGGHYVFSLPDSGREINGYQPGGRALGLWQKAIIPELPSQKSYE